MINKLKKYTFNQYIAFIAGLMLLIDFVGAKEYFNQSIFIGLIFINILSIAFCILYILKPHNNKSLSIILLFLGMIQILRYIREFSFQDTNSDEISAALFLSMFYICSFLSLKNKMPNNIITIVLGVYNFVYNCMSLQHWGYFISFYAIISSLGIILFNLLIIILICDVSLKKINDEQLQLPQNQDRLNDLKELLDGEYITREEYEIMKKSIINVYKM